MINYFPPSSEEWQPRVLDGSPFRFGYELAPCPWNEENTLLWLAMEAKSLDYRDAPPANLVFLIDVSGSMNSSERLPLVKASLKFLLERLRPEDRISIVTYAGYVEVALEPTSARDKSVIRRVIDGLGASGSTAGGAALQMAYERAEAAFIPEGVNRILLCTDGDFNVGVSDTQSLTGMVAQYRQKGITLSVLGFGTDNLNDEMMVSIADKGNGNYSYIDSFLEAQKVLGEEMASTLVTVAKDVKVQIEFNPDVVQDYRQIGYEKRQLRSEDFNNDRVDAGEVGAGKRVTVLYELVPVGKRGSVDPRRYRNDPRQSVVSTEGRPDQSGQSGQSGKADELAYLKLRWKEPDGNASELLEAPLMKQVASASFDEAGLALRFTASVAAFGQKLRAAPELDGASWKEIAAWAKGARGKDPGGYRSEMVRLVGLAEGLDPSR
jgi:Ca-activated chloride channel family protein